MKSLSRVGFGLSVVFGCLFLALFGEIYYLLWWKKRKNVIIANEEESCHITTQRDISEMLYHCKKATSSLTLELCSSPNLVNQPPSSSSKPLGEENFHGPTFLSTITEETQEDLEESEDGIIIRIDNNNKNATRVSLSNLLHVLETPFMTPLASPPYLTPSSSLSPIPHIFNKNCEFGSLNKLKCSPPPKFKFLRDAEAKFLTQSHERKDDLHLSVLSSKEDVCDQ